MQEEKDTQEQVREALSGEGAAPAAAEAPEKEASPEVKTEENVSETEGSEPAEAKQPVNVDKLQEQVNNLNIALKEARAEAKGKVDQSKVEELEAKLNERENLITRLQGVFVPEPEPELEQPKYLTADEAEQLWQQKQEEANQAAFKEKQAEMIKNEIVTLEKEWDGKNGKPAYNDQEVLKWQQENSKLYLSPAEAFAQMNRKAIIDWEVKQRLAGKKPVEDVEKPGVSPDTHTPPDVKIENEDDVRKAVQSAIDAANAEM